MYNEMRDRIRFNGLLNVMEVVALVNSLTDRQEALLECVRIFYIIMFPKEEQCDMNDN